MFNILLISIIAVQSIGHAAPSEPASLKELALKENKIEGIKKSSSTDARIESMISLKDPKEDVVSRTWNYVFSVSAQSFQPRGVIQNEVNGSFDLNKNSSTMMPSLGLGFSSPVKIKEFEMNWGAEALVGYTNQKTEARFPSGYTEKDVRLSSTLLRTKPVLGFNWSRLKYVTARLGYEFGYLNYVQTSTNHLATFSKQAPYKGFSYGLDININKKWALTTLFSERDVTNKKLDVEKNSFELGLQTKW